MKIGEFVSLSEVLLLATRNPVVGKKIVSSSENSINSCFSNDSAPVHSIELYGRSWQLSKSDLGGRDRMSLSEMNVS